MQLQLQWHGELIAEANAPRTRVDGAAHDER
jgi:hypothetical protein